MHASPQSAHSITTLVAILLATSAIPVARAQDVLPRPPQPFRGEIGRTERDSRSDFPKPVEPPPDAPNIVLILTDDVGYGASSTFGGPVPTPTFDRLAANGLRYTQFHTTALCSPTRAALITGRNHHSNATGVITEFATGYPGYNSLMPRSSGTLAQVLRHYGYNTAWFGKNHNVPDWQTSQAGPFDLWPTTLGFNYFYGFIGGDTDQWHPALFEGVTPIEAGHGDSTYILDRDLADHAITWIRMQHAMAPQRPFFVYYASGTAHAPHHAPREWIRKMRGKFDQGWDKVREETLARQKQLGVVPANTKLTVRPDALPPWDTLSADRKRLYARMMEVYAGALGYADYQIGRVIDAIDKIGELENTLVIYIMGDNGASGEGTLQGTTNEVATNANGVTEDLSYLLSMIDKLGGPLTYNHYPAAWAHAMDTPFQWTKQVASHFGGTRNAMVMSWPRRITEPGVRTQFHHVIDVVPTVYEAIGLTAPTMLDGVTQSPIEGVSMLYTVGSADAPSQRKTQYFEMLGNRALYHNGWVAATQPRRLPWQPTAAPGSDDPMSFTWELYHVANDYSQADNVAARYPDTLRALQDLFWVEAKRYNVLPLSASFVERVDPSIRPSLTRGRTTFTYYPGMIRIPEGATPDLKNRSYTLEADVEIPRTGVARGVLATQGGRFGGWGLLVVSGKPVFVHALSNQPKHKYRVAGAQPLTPGRHTIRFEFAYDGQGVGGGGTGKLFVDGKQVARGRIERTVGRRFSLDETFDVGEDTGTPVIEDYVRRMPYRFSGTLNRFTIILPTDGSTARGGGATSGPRIDVDP